MDTKTHQLVSRIVIVLITLNLLSTTARSQIKYYISNSGNDLNDGKSRSSALKALDSIKPGNTYLFKAGDIFYLNINKIENPLKKKIIIGAYGSGEKPIISCYKNINPEAWKLYSNNIWRVDLKLISNYTGFLNNNNTNVGFIKADGKIYGNKLNSIDLLNATWDFYSDKQFLYVYTNGNPSKLASLIQIVTDINIISLSDDMEISGVSLTGTGAHAIQGVNVNNVVLNGININEIGGSYLPGFGNGDTRYGNGIEFWNNASNCIVKNCNVQNVYDVAFTIQSSKPNSNFSNIVFTNNKASNNEQSFEAWVQGGNSNIKGCMFFKNYCYDAGYGWSHSVRPDKKVGVHLLFYYLNGITNDIVITNNVFSNAKTGFIHLPQNVPDNSDIFQTKNNKFIQNALRDN
jgi:hypothetical protein